MRRVGLVVPATVGLLVVGAVGVKVFVEVGTGVCPNVMESSATRRI